MESKIATEKADKNAEIEKLKLDIKILEQKIATQKHIKASKTSYANIYQKAHGIPRALFLGIEIVCAFFFLYLSIALLHPDNKTTNALFLLIPLTVALLTCAMHFTLKSVNAKKEYHTQKIIQHYDTRGSDEFTLSSLKHKLHTLEKENDSSNLPK